MIDIYDNCIDLRMENYGVIHGGSQTLASYTFPKSFDILGMVYGVGEDALTGIASGTTVGELKAVAGVGGFTDVKVLGKNGAEVADDALLSNEMTLMRTGSLGEQSYALSDAPAPEAPLFRRGDANGDGEVTAKDVTFLRRAIANGTADVVAHPEMDANGDGEVTAKDVTFLRRAIANGTV